MKGPPFQWNPYWHLYRLVMRIAHRFNWHYAPPIYPGGDKQLWCTWCGMRYQVPKKRTELK